MVVGEVLYDRFPDGDRLGGAPFNVAWHLTGLGLDPLFVSRIGNDPAGDQIRSAMAGHGMDTSGLQTDPSLPTGIVQIELDGAGGHEFTILPDQAYDQIDRAALANLLGGTPPSLICFGTLALRAAGSRAAILNTVTHCPGTRFLDVNLRKECWTVDTVSAALTHASVAKLNDEELATLGSLFGLRGREPKQASALRDRFGLEAVCVTRGAGGALWVDANGALEAGIPDTVEVVDTVGAGDAFSSVLIMGLARGWLPEDTLRRATRLAAVVCGMRGACPDDPGFYRIWREKWMGTPA